MQHIEVFEINPMQNATAAQNNSNKPRDTNPTFTAAVIWLHGLGADGHDFEGLVEEFNRPDIHFLLPSAPYRPVSLNNGYEMRAWYDIYGLANNSQQDEAGIRQMTATISHLIESQNKLGIKCERILLAGFSQGGAMVLHTALRYKEKLAGILALSTYLPLRDKLANEANHINANIPIFMAHGSFDNVIPMGVAKTSMEALTNQRYQVAWHEYPMAHSLCLEEVADIRAFINKVLPPI